MHDLLCEFLIRVSFRFTSCHLQSLSQKLTTFTILCLYMACKMRKNHCAHLRDIELKPGKKISYLRFPHVLFYILEIASVH